jgi:hypothetical protein
VALLRGKAERQGKRERGRLRRHLRELEDLREERLPDFGGLALEMHRREKIERSLLWKPAAEIAAIVRPAPSATPAALSAPLQPPVAPLAPRSRSR